MNTPHMVLFENAEYDIIVQINHDEQEQINQLENSIYYSRLYGDDYISTFKSDIKFVTYEHITSIKKLKKELNNEH